MIKVFAVEGLHFTMHGVLAKFPKIIFKLKKNNNEM